MTLEDKLVFDLPCWNNLSPHVKDLITLLLNKDPYKRVSLENALIHKWFQGLAVNEVTGLPQSHNSSKKKIT